jgi:hypothetical protein
MFAEYLTRNPLPSEALRWWEKKRLRYNVGLVVAGVLAFAAYAALIVRFGDVINGAADPSEADEFSGLTLAIQGIGYLFMMFVANVCFLLGPLSERWVKPSDVAHYREKAFRFGLWFSVALPFAIPVLLLVNLWRGAFVSR